MNKQQIEAAAKILKAIANKNRLKVLYLIAEREMSVGEIEAMLDLSQSALSQHLAVLRAGNIVKTKRVAQTIFYGIKNDKVKELLHMLSVLFR